MERKKIDLGCLWILLLYLLCSILIFYVRPFINGNGLIFTGEIAWWKMTMAIVIQLLAFSFVLGISNCAVYYFVAIALGRFHFTEKTVRGISLILTLCLWWLGIDSAGSDEYNYVDYMIDRIP